MEKLLEGNKGDLNESKGGMCTDVSEFEYRRQRFGMVVLFFSVKQKARRPTEAEKDEC